MVRLLYLRGVAIRNPGELTKDTIFETLGKIPASSKGCRHQHLPLLLVLSEHTSSLAWIVHRWYRRYTTRSNLLVPLFEGDEKSSLIRNRHLFVPRLASYPLILRARTWPA